MCCKKEKQTMKKIFFAFLASLFAGSLPVWKNTGNEAFAQQDAQYSQYMFNLLSVTPAVAGSREVFITSLHYRKQWTEIEGSPTTTSFSMQAPMKKKKIGLGAELGSDKLGPKNVNRFLVSYAYRIPLSKGKLAFGLRVGMYNYIYDLKYDYFKDHNDVHIKWGRSSRFTPTGDFGVHYYTRTFYVGLSTTHLNRGKVLNVSSDSARQKVHLFIPMSKAYTLGNTVINPTLLLKGVENAPTEIDLGCNVLLRDKLWLGLSFRSGYGSMLLAQYQINDKMKVGYSYDFGVNKIGKTGGGSHEIMIGYDINIHGSKVLMPRYL